MLDALSSLLPDPVPIHHLGLYREKSTLQPVEYYNNLPYHRTSPASTTQAGTARGDRAKEGTGPAELAIVVDPVIATGATATAAVETLRDWGVRRVIVICVLGSREGVRKVCESWGDGAGEEAVQVFCAGLDEATDLAGMIVPGLGDVGDRLYLTIGK